MRLAYGLGSGSSRDKVTPGLYGADMGAGDHYRHGKV